MKIYNLFQSMWILEHWKICAESPTEVRRKFRLAFNLRYDQLPHIWAYKREYMRIKKTKSADHLVGGKKVSPDRFKMTPECANLEQVAAVKEHARKVDSGTSLRDRSLDLDIPRATIHTILRYNIGMKAWKILEVQELKPIHYPARKKFCEWLLQQPAGFEDRVIWSDEKIFVLHMRVNKQNDRVWGIYNPRAYRDWRLTVDLGYYFGFEPTYTVHGYKAFLDTRSIFGWFK